MKTINDTACRCVFMTIQIQWCLRKNKLNSSSSTIDPRRYYEFALPLGKFLILFECLADSSGSYVQGF